MSHTPGPKSIRLAVESDYPDHSMVAYHHAYLEQGISFGELRELWAQRAALLEAAKAISVPWRIGTNTSNYYATCPSCGQVTQAEPGAADISLKTTVLGIGHTDDCNLVAAIKLAEEGEA